MQFQLQPAQGGVHGCQKSCQQQVASEATEKKQQNRKIEERRLRSMFAGSRRAVQSEIFLTLERAGFNESMWFVPRSTYCWRPSVVGIGAETPSQ